MLTGAAGSRAAPVSCSFAKAAWEGGQVIAASSRGLSSRLCEERQVWP
jgi:hypothetical protein